MYLLSVLVLDGAGPVAVSVSKNNSYSVSDVDVAASLLTSGNSGSDAANQPSPNNSEEPLSLELHSASVSAQVSVSRSVLTYYMIPCMCVQYSVSRQLTRQNATRFFHQLKYLIEHTVAQVCNIEEYSAI